MTATRFHIGIDLAWIADGKKGNESGVVMLDSTGNVAEAGWTVGVDETVRWLDRHSPADVLLFVDAPLVVNNEKGQRLCEKEVGQRYGRWKVSANSTNRNSANLGGVELLDRLLARSWTYHDGTRGPPATPGRFVSECYPYTTIVGACELGYGSERPVYKRQPKGMSRADFRKLRSAECDELVRRVSQLTAANPPMKLLAHPETARLVAEKSPKTDQEYKHREDLLDAAICAWTAALWDRAGETRCQVLGRGEPLSTCLRSTMIAPARREQRPRVESVD